MNYEYITDKMEYDIALMDLKGKRFKKAEGKFIGLLKVSNSYKAWCGLAIAKAGLIMEDTTVEEIFYCFDKAKDAPDAEAEDIRSTVFQLTNELMQKIATLGLESNILAKNADREKARMAIKTALGAAFTLKNTSEERPANSIVSATFTAFSYDGYLKAIQNADGFRQLQSNCTSKLQEILTQADSYINEDEKKVLQSIYDVFNLQLQTSELGIPKERLQYIQDKKEELNDAGHPYHTFRRQALEHYGKQDFLNAMKNAERAIAAYPADPEMHNIKEKSRKVLKGKVWGRTFFLIFLAMCLIGAIGQDPNNSGIAGVLMLIAFFGITYFHHKQLVKNGFEGISAFK